MGLLLFAEEWIALNATEAWISFLSCKHGMLLRLLVADRRYGRRFLILDRHVSCSGLVHFTLSLNSHTFRKELVCFNSIRKGNH